MNSPKVLLYVAMPQELCLCEPAKHPLQWLVASDARRVTGNQDFVDMAPLDRVFVADPRRMTQVPDAQREAYAFAGAGAVA